MPATKLLTPPVTPSVKASRPSLLPAGQSTAKANNRRVGQKTVPRQTRKQSLGRVERLRYGLEYALLGGVGAVFCRLPRRVALTVGARLGVFAYYCLPLKKKTVIGNLSLAFPEKSARDIRRIARGVYQNFAKTVTEHLRLNRMDQADLRQIVHIRGEEHLRDALARNHGVVIIGGHLGNWEYMLGGITAAGYPVHAVVAPINNPFINDSVRTSRMNLGAHLLPKKGCLPEIVDILANNGIVGLMIDQDARKRGVFVDFMGRPASTVKGPAKLALTHNAALLFVVPETNPDLSITVTIQKIDTSQFAEATAGDIKGLMQRCSWLLEDHIRKDPTQWLWFHRRWKTRPPQESLTGVPIC